MSHANIQMRCMLQDGTHDLKSLGSGGMRLGPVSLVRAVGRVIRSVVGGDSDDSHQHQVSFSPRLDPLSLTWPLAVTSPPVKLLTEKGPLGDAWGECCFQWLIITIPSFVTC